MPSFRAACLAFLVFISATAACRAEDGDLRTLLEGRYAALRSAMADNDGDQVAALLAPDFLAVDVSGRQQTRRQLIAGVEKAVAHGSEKVSNTTLLSVEPQGGTAVVKQRYTLTGDRLGADRTKHPAELTTLSTDVWVSIDGKWLLQRTTTEQMDYVIDGKSMMHKIRKSEQ